METSREKWDKDDDGLIENANFPDQTYDTWKAVGLRLVVLIIIYFNYPFPVSICWGTIDPPPLSLL